MRALRTLIGLILVLACAPMMLAGLVGWNALQHRDASGGFATSLEPLRSGGHAVVVRDVDALLARHGIANRLGSGRLRVTARSSAGPLFLALAPAVDVGRYFDRVARSELSGVGFADGAAPVELTDIAGTANPSPPAGQAFWLLRGAATGSGDTLEWDTPLASQTPTALVLMRADGAQGVDATLVVALYPRWLNAATWSLLVGGSLALLAGLAVQFWPVRRRETVLVVEAHRMVDMADRIAEGLRGSPRRRQPASVPRTLVPVPPGPGAEDIPDDAEPAAAGQGRWRARVVTNSDRIRALRRNLRRLRGPRSELDGPGTPDTREVIDDGTDAETASAGVAPTGGAVDERTAESPYVYTAT
jgi:hypothetical protein